MRYVALILGTSVWLGTLSAKPSHQQVITGPEKEGKGISSVSAQLPLLALHAPTGSGMSSSMIFHRSSSPSSPRGGGRCVEEGSIVGDLYYGFFTLAGGLVRAAGAADGSRVLIIGPIGLRGEYMLGDVIGLGVDIQYNRYSLSWQEEFYSFATMRYETYSYDMVWTRFRVMPRMAFHFAVSSKVDPYASISGGLILNSFSVETNDPLGYDAVGISGIGPAVRFAVGTRFFFTPNIGAFAELGVFGGGLFHLGLSAKLK